MSGHAQHRMHPNSLAAYEAEAAALGARAGAIYRTLAARGPMTDREVRDALGFGDMNAVRPRITELIADGKLQEVDEKAEGRRTVRVVDVVRAQQRELFK